ncbi:FAD/NAD(P)-binding protein [Rhizobium sp. BK251]|uniref:FAD/NAD(P)-binding protein n=1 Tax=Rhizobium sp. BK251 TaxID=2512125 RepID=UPI0010444CE9|nr:FAD/NAD(P)-binding protein [Rhizobium sp. BK251]TCL65178.1 putative NAD(P)/FAD-binding protein YdhS [Rhizobium sp. BK251]
MSDRDGRPVIAIIGGGVSGAGVAFNLARAADPCIGQIIVFEPREKLGAGLAYDTADLAHRINVPAARMSLVPAEPEQFERWIADHHAIDDDPKARRPDGQLFPRRRVFGEYVDSKLQPLVRSGRIRHVRSIVTDVSRHGGRWRLASDSGAVLEADIVVIATSHPPPTAPEPLASVLRDHPRFVADPTTLKALDRVRADDSVLVVGNGLTSADVIASLTARGHKGRITAISRRGLRSRGHAPFPQEPYSDFLDPPAKSAVKLLGRVRRAIREAEAAGLTWHPVIDQVRGQGQDIWAGLPLAERRRIVRHLRPYWDVHRFRVAPQVEEVLDEALAEGRLELLAASVVDTSIEGERIRCILRTRGRGGLLERLYDAVVITTGPGHRGILVSQKWIARLADEGYLALDAAGLGFSCDRESRALGAAGQVSPSLFISGPLARGTFGELMGLPQVTEHAVFVAEQVLAHVRGATTKA